MVLLAVEGGRRGFPRGNTRAFDDFKFFVIAMALLVGRSIWEMVVSSHNPDK